MRPIASSFSNNERSLRAAIQEKRVRWHEYRVNRAIAEMPTQANDNPQPLAPTGTSKP